MSNTKHVFRSILSVILGLIVILFLPLITNQLLRASGVFPQGSPELALVYRSIYVIIGSYITARFAPYASMKHSILLGVIVFLFYSFGTYGIINIDFLGTPLWYAYGVVIMVLPCAFLGVLLHRRFHMKYKKYEPITQTKTTAKYTGFQIALMLLLLIAFWFILSSIIMTIGIYSGLCYWEFIPSPSCVEWTEILSTIIILIIVFIFVYKKKNSTLNWLQKMNLN